VTPERLEALLAAVASGAVTPATALERLRHFPTEELDFARLDHHRTLRQGQPEVVYCTGKTVAQVEAICDRFAAALGGFLGTRASEEQAQALAARHPGLEWNPLARTVLLRAGGRPAPTGRVLVVSAGTSDLPVGEEAAVTAEAMGHEVERLADVGVAGLHRLLGRAERSTRPTSSSWWRMEGALPSVVGGLVGAPVIAVPTSVGYGASYGGLAALLAMLNSCAAGITVVNIDNGFGAGMAASRILRSRSQPAG
jgi:NCAIR mutase (PurE)-related protein